MQFIEHMDGKNYLFFENMVVTISAWGQFYQHLKYLSEEVVILLLFHNGVDLTHKTCTRTRYL